MPEVVEATYTAKAGHYDEVEARLLAFAPTYLHVNPALKSLMVIGDAGTGVVRAIAVYDSHDDAAAVNSDPIFASFADEIGAFMVAAPQRTLMKLVHTFSQESS